MVAQHVDAARLYAQIAPSAPHALHMPSHIYTRLGMWEDSIASNMAARKAAHEQGDIGEELHAMDYLTYADLQLGRDQDAARVVDDSRKMTNLSPKYLKVAYAASAMPRRATILNVESGMMRHDSRRWMTRCRRRLQLPLGHVQLDLRAPNR